MATLQWKVEGVAICSNHQVPQAYWSLVSLLAAAGCLAELPLPIAALGMHCAVQCTGLV